MNYEFEEHQAVAFLLEISTMSTQSFFLYGRCVGYVQTRSQLEALSIEWRKWSEILSGQEGQLKSAAHLVKWDSTSRPICYGGLGIGSFRQKNNALPTKWLWRFCKGRQCFMKTLNCGHIRLRGEWLIY